MHSIPVRRDAPELQPPLHEILPLQETIKIVDVGANFISDVPPYAPLLASGRGELVGFEPNPEALRALEARKGPRETYLPYAVGDGGRHELRLCAHSGMSSLLEPNQALLSFFQGFSQWGTVVSREPVDTVRLDDVAETLGMDMLKIDIQGGELMVFQNARERLSQTLVVHTEVEFIPMYLGQPLFADVDQFLRSCGFMFHRFDQMIGRNLAPFQVGEHEQGRSQAIWSDAIYIPDITRMSAAAPRDLLKLATILHDCYRAYDVVYRVLREEQGQTGSRFGDLYAEVLLAAAKAQ